ncbi:hypothetical protein GCM10011578_083560 [Streptomyces fuscichromogenes]|uniref:Fatty acid desaturase domain-containing protein n=1 Tax=Streptomyces fuscichromogenes TaxID=1324013 RepID=A0A917XM31_9ACTN|nr:hypothetical protein GCM10011578_083560 [Streptomyces fuscichromogenes]
MRPVVVNSLLTNAWALRWSRCRGVWAYAYAGWHAVHHLIPLPPAHRPFAVGRAAGRPVGWFVVGGLGPES